MRVRGEWGQCGIRRDGCRGWEEMNVGVGRGGCKGWEG